MRPSTLAFPLLAALLPAAANASTFNVIANVPGSPTIGAFKGATLYGTTQSGGSGFGTLFSLSQTGSTYTLLHTFNGSSDGSSPTGELAVDSANDVFGATSAGGADGGGTLWGYAHKKKAEVFEVLHAFGSVIGDGLSPVQGPTIYNNSVLVGSAPSGAAYSGGLIYALRIGKEIYSDLHSFEGGTDGETPLGGVARGRLNDFFGTTAGNGTGGAPNGTVWRLANNGRFVTLYTFQDGNDGEYPNQTPVVDYSNNVYGTTSYQAGAPFAGAIWTVSKKGRFSVLHDFNAYADGSGPNGPLVLNTDGNLYCATQSGGPNGYGTIFEITPTGTFTVLWAFANGSDGANPTGPIVHDTFGNIYGGTATGQIFEITP
jgi:uncharacterized repeat protein (TIGR03803 family)